MTTGTIHNLSYQRYSGPRLAPWTRPFVIARYALIAQWRQRGVKIVLLLALVALAVTAVVVGGIWYFSNAASAGAPELERSTRAMVQEANALVVTATLRSQMFPSFLLVLLCGAPAISRDLTAGAFQFHFARPVGVVQYLVGRLLSAGAWAVVPPLVTLGVLSVGRLALGGEPFTVVSLSLRAAVVTVVLIAVLSSVSLGVSSVTRRAGLAQALFAALVLGSMFITAAVEAATHRAWVGAVDVMGAPLSLAQQFTHTEHSLHGIARAAPAIACALWFTLGMSLAARRLSTAEVLRG